MNTTRRLLPAFAYRTGDRVLGEDGDESIFGRVSPKHGPLHSRHGRVVVLWDGEPYDELSLGHAVDAELLRLDPPSEHQKRLSVLVDSYTEKESLLDRSVRIARLALAFGRVNRATRHEDGRRPETDSDHTVMLGWLACDIAEGLCLDLDLGLLSQFASVHDMVEVYANDTQTLIIDAAGRADKARREEAAKARLREELGSCWLTETLDRYERQEDAEAQFIRVLDKVLPKLTHLLNGCAAAKELTDEVGFKASHEAQAKDLSHRYRAVAFEIHELLWASMEASEAAWNKEGASRLFEEVLRKEGASHGP